MPSEAYKQFEELMESVDELIDIHGRIQVGKGRRHRLEALHRAGVVLTVAAWQAYCEKVTDECLDQIETIFGPGKKVLAWAASSFYFRRPAVKKSIGDLNTPNSQNVIRLFDWSFGCDIKSAWVWNVGRRVWDSGQFCQRTDEWLRIRHAIAHGNQLPQNLTWLKNDSNTARLKLSLLQECVRHFVKLASLTDAALAKHLRKQYGLKVKW